MSEGRGIVMLVGIVFAAALAATAPTNPIQMADNGRPPVAQQQTEPAHSANKADADAKQGPRSSPGSRLYVEATCEHDCGYSEDDKGWWDKLQTDPVATFTAVLALLTLGLILVGAVQSALLYRANINTEAAFAASRRAYVFCSDIFRAFERPPGGGNPTYGFRPMWTNSGETQTKGMMSCVNAEFRDDPLPADFDFNGPHTPPWPHTLGPKVTSAGGNARSFTVDEIQMVVNGTKFLYLWGWARYHDVFPSSEQHISRYCVQVQVFGNPFNPEGGPTVFNMTFLVHPIGNCSDGECVAQGMG